MSKAFDTINIHTLIRKLLQTNIPDTIIKFIANYIKGRKAYTTYKNHTSNKVNLKLAFHKVASFLPHYLTFTPQTYHQCTGSGHGLRRQYHNHIYTHTSTSAAKKYIQPYQERLSNLKIYSLHTGTLAYSSFRWKGIRMFNSLPMHIRNITACPPSVFKKQLDLHLSPMLDCPCTPNFNNSLDNKY